MRRKGKRKPYMKGLSALTLAFLMAFSLLPGQAIPAHAADDPGTDGKNEILQQASDHDDTFAPENGYSLGSSKSKPPAFDLRTRNCITPVRQQNPFGSCWGFGAIAAAESSIISSGLASDPEKLNLSEKQVAWFVTKEINDSSNKQNGEGLVSPNGATDSDRYNNGGFPIYATNLFASGVGPIAESTSTDDGQVYYYSGKNRTVVNNRVTWYDDNNILQTGYKKTYYSEDDDWSIPDKYRFRQDYKLKESYLLPSPSLPTSENSVQTVYQPEGTEAIKDQLLNSRAVCVCVYATHSRPGDNGESPQTNELYAQYSTGSSPNHVVTIVGYDDNFPKEKFMGDEKPDKDGAWLVKNSWGADTCDFPDNGYSHWGLLEGQDRPGTTYKATSNKHTGYYWLSYYDTSIRNPEAYSFETADDHSTHQYDYMPIMQYEEYATESVIKTANIFTEDQNRKIEDISFFTATPGTTVTYKIILLKKGWTDPEKDGECVYSSSSKKYNLGGFHREKLNSSSDIIVSRKQDYAVILEEKTPSGKYSMTFGKSMDGPYGVFRFNSVINKKESFLYLDDEWQDLSTESVQTTLLGGKGSWLMDNFPIKVGLSNVDNQNLYFEVRYKSDENAEVLKVGQTSHFEINFVGGTDDLNFTPTVTWTSSDPEILSVNPTNSEKSEADITGLKGGRANIIIDAGIYGKRVLCISVYELSIVNVYMGKDVVTMTYTGSPLIPEIADVSGQVSDSVEAKWGLVKDTDYYVTCTDNVNCGKAHVRANGMGHYVRYDESWFVIVPAKARINKLTSGENTITVDFESQAASGISGYIISYKESGSDQTKTLKVDPTAASAQITGLTAGKTYDVSMKAYVTLDEEPMLIDKVTYDMRIPNDNVDYFGEESDLVTSDPVKEGQTEQEESSQTGPDTSTEDSTQTNPDTSTADSTQTSPGTSTADPTALEITERELQAMVNDGDLSGSGYLPLALLSKKVSKRRLRLNWRTVYGADTYIIYGNRCGKGYKMQKLIELPASYNSWTAGNLQKGKYYKFLVVACQTSQDGKKVISTSKTIHVATSGGKVGNHKKVKLNKTKIVLKQGKSFKLKAKAIPASSSKKVKRHVGIRFESSDNQVATVSKKGKILARGKGTCYIYAYAQNGIYKRAKVKVK